MTHAEVIKFYKGARNAALRLGVTTQAVNLWKKEGISERRQKHIQADSKGVLKADGGK
jgi:hypothetical protein